MRSHQLLLRLLLLLGIAGDLSGQTAAPPARPSVLAPGIRWWQELDPAGPWRIAVVRIDLTQRALALRAVHARDSLTGREAVSALVKRSDREGARVRVGINADFFDLKTGASENNQVTDGEWWRGQMVTDSPFDAYDNVHSQLAIAQDGRPAIGRFVLDGRAHVRGRTIPILGVNTRPTGTYEGTALFTARYAGATPRDTSRKIAEARVRRIGARGDTTTYVVDTVVRGNGGTTVTSDGAVLATYGDRTALLDSVRRGDTLTIWLGTLPRLGDGRPPQQLLGGWPRILEGGVNIAAEAAVREGTISRNAEARHPRSAVGISRDGKTLWLFVVDGRSTTSVGMTLIEVADRLRMLGAWDALNFDGGGSTTLVIDGRVVNVVSDPTGERSVGNALLVLERK